MANRGTVCHLTSVHSASDIRIFHKQCRSLAEAGFRVSLIAPHPQSEIAHQINIIGIAKARNRLLRMLLLPLKIFRAARKQRAEIYHFHDPELLPVGVLLKLSTRAKVIYDAHEDYAKQILYKAYIPAAFRKLLATGIHWFEQFSIRFFDAVVTATDDILKNFHHHPHAQSVRNFPILANFDNGVPVNHSNTTSIQAIYTGGLSPERGIAQMVQAFGHLTDDKSVTLTLCGKFYPAGFEESVRHLPAFARINYRGWVKMEEAIGLVKQSDIGLVCFLPEENHVNALPNKLFEYMAAGIPAIVSNFPLWREIVETNQCGLCVDPEKPHEIADAIRYLSQHPDERRLMGVNGKKAIQQLYRWENEAEKLIALYRAL